MRLVTSARPARDGNLSIASLLIVTLSFSSISAQDLSRRPLEHKDYDVWNTIARASLSNDGGWVMYSVQSGAIDGEATLHLHQTKTGREYVIPRASGQITHDSRFAVYRITPDKKTVKRLKKEKKKPEELPKTKLQILDLAKGSVITIPNVRSFQLPEEHGQWVACLLEKQVESDELASKKADSRESYEVTNEGLRRPEKPLKLKSREELARERGEKELEEQAAKPETKEEAASESPKDDDAEDKKKDKTDGTPLILIDLRSGIQRTYPNVVSYRFSKNGKTLAFATSEKPDEVAEKNDDGSSHSDKSGKSAKEEKERSSRDGVHVIDLESLEQITIARGPGDYKNLSFNEDGSQLAFITNQDDYQAKTPTWAVYHWAARSKEAKKIATEGDQGIIPGWWIAPGSSPVFSEDGRRLYFETAPIAKEVLKEREAKKSGRDIEEDDEDEQVKLDIWHWQDPQLQPQQLLQAEIERKRKYQAAYVLKTKRIAQLATRQVPVVRIDYESPSDVAVANTNMKYRKTLSWDVPGFQDTYLINLNSGEQKLILEQVKSSPSISPQGKFIVWFDAEQRKYFAKPTKDAQSDPVEISKGIHFPLHDELHDTPNLPRAYGTAGWTTDDKALLVYDRYDIWQLDPTGKSQPVCITSGLGRKNSIRFRYRSLDVKQRSIDPSDTMILSAFNRETKASGYYSLKLAGSNAQNSKDKDEGEHLRSLIMLDEDLGILQKAEQSEQVLLTRSTFQKCPDLWSSTTSFEKIHRVSDINPQQEKYTWGTAELTHWKGSDGQDLDGILLKPDGFDSSKQYPLMVYFYERNSDNLHRYYPPAAGRSIICHSFYVSRGYVVFIPDIPYKVGQPGNSAANSVIPGVHHLISQGFVDKDRIGMQGHSWGGYQTAYLVTQTDLFACAESGAPVSNMTSAYGGIRWGSGMSRMFQYERTQSRIGDDLWSAREKYIANSPLFLADKINTPLLILHNDEDGAVPWYQGIELFVALRRLEKPAWMLNYNGNPHWVMGDYNRRDFAVRMQQFFDHYLKDAPEPEWMAVGIPAVQKGKNDGLELLEPPAAKKD